MQPLQLEELDFAAVYKAVSEYMGIAASAPISEVLTFLTSFPSSEIDFALLMDPSIPTSAARAAAISLRYHPFFQTIVFDDNVAGQLFDSLRMNDVIHTLRGKNLWSASLLDLGAVLPLNPHSSLQVSSFLHYFSRFPSLSPLSFKFSFFLVGVC
jgi:hypothetical protein